MGFCSAQLVCPGAYDQDAQPITLTMNIDSDVPPSTSDGITRYSLRVKVPLKQQSCKYELVLVLKDLKSSACRGKLPVSQFATPPETGYITIGMDTIACSSCSLFSLPDRFYISLVVTEIGLNS